MLKPLFTEIRTIQSRIKGSLSKHNPIKSNEVARPINYKLGNIHMESLRFPTPILIWLVVSTLKNISQWEGLSHLLWKINNVWNHQPDGDLMGCQWGYDGDIIVVISPSIQKINIHHYISIASIKSELSPMQPPVNHHEIPVKSPKKAPLNPSKTLFNHMKPP